MKGTTLLIGAGRMAKHLRHWHQLLQTPYELSHWQRADGIEQLKQKIQAHQIIWLAIRDSEIVSFYNEHLKDQNKTVVHFSGALHDERLLSAHPLMSFPNQLFELAVYQKIHFTLTGFKNLEVALPGFKNSFSILSPEQKNIYHALCVMTGNFPQMLWAKTYPQFADLHIPTEALDHYVLQVTQNFINEKEKALTGPLIRQDWPTIEKNKIALKPQAQLLEIYNSFTPHSTKDDT